MNLADELILLLLNEESGYFHQVPGWNLNCAVASAALADLALAHRIDTDPDSLYLTDPTETGDPTLDSILQEISKETQQRNTQYWIERLSPRAESIVDSTLERLVERQILNHHSGGFWTLAPSVSHTQAYEASQNGETTEFVKTRVGKLLFEDGIPDPRDAILVALANVCDVLHLIFPLDEAARERVEFVSNVDLIGRSIAEAVSQSITGPKYRRALRTRPIPSVRVREALFSRHARVGNLPALFGELTTRHGPVFRLRPPFAKNGLLVVAGPAANRWMQRDGRNFLRSKDYLEDFANVYGASRILPSMDGADHFRMRKSIRSTYSRAALEGRLDELYLHAKSYLQKWSAGDVLPAVTTFRELTNAQFSQLSVGLDTQDCIGGLLEYKQRSLMTHIQRALPKFMLKTPGMKRRKKELAVLVERIHNAHTPAQRAGCPRDIIDDLLSVHESDPQFLPETDLPFSLVSPLIVSLYLGNALSFAVYQMVLQPSLHEKIEAEADRLFANGYPEPADLKKSEIDVTNRFLMETQRLYPIIPMQVRTVMNACVVEGYELPVGAKVYIAQSAAHYMDDVFPDSSTFDIDRYLPSRREHRGPEYAPYGLGTHMCLGYRWVELQLAVNLLMLTRFFRLELASPGYKLRINPFPTLAPDKKLKIRVAEKRYDL